MNTDDFKDVFSELPHSLHGIEMEGLRVDRKGLLSLTPHPKEFGSKLTDPHISTDFSESQVEMITPPFEDAHEAYLYLRDLQKFICMHMKDLLWCYSGPCILPKEELIPIADFGPSKSGKSKTLYREGLSSRYGKKMQMLSGVHYNFSFSQKFWKRLHVHTDEKLPLSTFISESYLKIIRNFLRFGWICTYLFGVTPALDTSYFSKQQNPLVKWKERTLYAPYATSLRMSKFGYMNKIECQKPVSFNNLEDYVADLQYRISTPHPKFRKLKKPQMNSNIFQIEAEHYSRIRPKAKLSRKTHLEAIRKGIQYLEIRNMDIHPFCASGLEMNELYFLQIFLLFCLFASSRKMNLKEQSEVCVNQNRVALYGRKPMLELFQKGKPISLRKWALQILDKMKPFSEIYDQAWNTRSYSRSFEEQKEKVLTPSLTPSAHLITELQKNDLELYDFILKKAKRRCL